MRVTLRMEHVLSPPITRQQLLSHKELASCSLWLGVQGTNLEIPTPYRAPLEALVSPEKPKTAQLHQELEAAEIEANDNQAFSPKDVQDARQKILASVVRRRGRKQFRQQLLDAYNFRCAITGCDAVEALEAAHIFPYKGEETDHVGNGLLLRADIHTLFDLGHLSIEPNSRTVVLSAKLLNSAYAELNGKALDPPSELAAHPSSESLHWHYNEIFLNKVPIYPAAKSLKPEE